MPAHLPPLRAIAVGLWLAGFAAYVALEGLPTRRTIVLVWVALAVIALGAGRPRATLRSFATTWLPLFGALAAYDLLRGVSDGDTADAHTWPHLQLDLWIGAGRTPSERLQEAFWDPSSPAWWDYAAWAVYQSHFLVPLLVAVVLWGMRHHLATRYVVGVALLSWAALATYWLYPAQPPWMTARDGLTGDVTRVVQRMWQDVGVERAARVFTTDRAAGSQYSNPVAALPSLHAAFPMLIAATLRGVDRRLDAVLAAYVLAMGVTLVYAGEHFIFDVVLGWVFAIAVAAAVRRYQTTAPITGKVLAEPQALSLGTGGSGLVGSASRSR